MKVNKIRMRETLVSYAFLAPILIFFTVFVLAPMIMGFVTSFFNYSMTSFKFVGLENYSRMFADKVFVKSLINTVIIVIGSVPIVVLFSLFVASQTYHQNAIARSFYRFVFFLPVVTGSVAVTVVWKWIYDPLSGILNFVLKSGHVINQNISWLGDKHWALMAIIIILLTTSVGQPIILYIAAMGNIDNSLVEAARVDGATEFQVFWKIKWPSLLPTTLYIAIITTINSFQCFALIQLLTSGGPNYSTSTLMYYLYEKAFKLSEIRLCQHHGCLPCGDDCHYQFCAIQDPRKRRRILKKGASDETNTKETHHCLYSDFNDHFAPFDCLVHFPILLDFDRGL